MSTFLSIGEVKMVFSEEVKTKAFERERMDVVSSVVKN
jgi:hypothetical protein